MKKKINFKHVIILAMIGGLISCQTGQEFSELQIECEEPDLIPNTTIDLVKKMYVFGAPVRIESDLILEGYVSSDDKSGNFYKTIVIQDAPENPKSAIKISIDESQLYSKYNVGRRIYVQLNGLAIGMHFGSLQIGKYNQGGLESISSFEINNYIQRSCVQEQMIPKKVEIATLNEEHYGMLIALSDVQYKDFEVEMAYGNPDNNETVTRVLESFSNDCHLMSTIDLRTSGYADFKNEHLPNGKGTVVGILDNYYDEKHLLIRSTADVVMKSERCNYSAVLKPTISLLQLRDYYQGERVEFGTEQALILEGFVISSDKSGNFQKRLVIQDAIENPKAGIQILLNLEQISDSFTIGDKVLLKLDKLYMDMVEGILTIGIPKNGKLQALSQEMIGNHIFNSFENFQIVPKIVPLEASVNLVYENTLIKIENIQLVEQELGSAFAYFSGNDHGIRSLGNCESHQKLSLFTNGEAVFANKIFPTGRGSTIGVMAKNLVIRDEDDLNFDKEYEQCPQIVTEILITEVADPANSTGARFIELFNPGSQPINLNGWKLNKYNNGSTTVSSGGLDLSGLTISPQGFLVLANESFKSIFNAEPDFESNYISSNGDDVYELVDNTNNRIDVFGTVGTDGNGTNWEFLDGKAVRKSTILQPNKEFDNTEWIVYSKALNAKIDFPSSAQIAPENFTPWAR